MRGSILLLMSCLFIMVACSKKNADALSSDSDSGIMELDGGIFEEGRELQNVHGSIEVIRSEGFEVKVKEKGQNPYKGQVKIKNKCSDMSNTKYHAATRIVCVDPKGDEYSFDYPSEKYKGDFNKGDTNTLKFTHIKSEFESLTDKEIMPGTYTLKVSKDFGSCGYAYNITSTWE